MWVGPHFTVPSHHSLLFRLESSSSSRWWWLPGACLLSAGLFLGYAVGSSGMLVPQSKKKDLDGPLLQSLPPPPPTPASTATDSDELRRLNDHLTSERAGRVRAERSLRESVNKAVTSVSGGGYPLLPIGRIKSPFRGRWGTPRQGMLAPHSRAHIVLSPAIPAVALQGLTEFSHVFVLFLFHENSSMHKLARVQGPGYQRQRQQQQQQQQSRRKGGEEGGEEGGSSSSSSSAAVEAEEDEDATMTRLLRERNFNAFIEAPALKGGRTGALATRSPHRPNAIGLSLCRLVAVHSHTPGSNKANSPMIVLSGCDLLEGTPVVDIKPYAPYDCPTCMGDLVGPRGGVQGGGVPPYSPPHTLPQALASLASAADITSSDAYELRGPQWVYGTLKDQASARLPVVWGEGTAEFVMQAVREGKTRYYGLREAALHKSSSSSSSGGGGGGGSGGSTSGGLEESEGRALLQALSQVLALDIRAVHHGRGGAPSETRGGASTVTPSLLRRMGLNGVGEGGGGVGEGASGDATEVETTTTTSSSSSSPPIDPATAAAGEPGVQYYELWFDVFDIKWQCIDAVEAGTEGTEGVSLKGGKKWFAKITSVSFAK